MNLQQRKELLVRLGAYMISDNEAWERAKQQAFSENNWFVPEFVQLSVENITKHFLTPEALHHVTNRYFIPEVQPLPKRIGIVMGGTIPLESFHDFFCVFLSGNIAVIKPASKDEILIKHLVKKLNEWDRETENYMQVQEMLKNCDAYIATISTRSSTYLEQYLNKYPHIIRKNRTSVAILTGHETVEELKKLSDDVHRYFGLGSRNVSKLYVPEGYDFVPLLNVFKKYNYFLNHHKYKNNYDYNLAVHILNNRFYMTSGSIIFVEDTSPFSPIGQLHFEYYTSKDEVVKELTSNAAIQCIIGEGGNAFGETQNLIGCHSYDDVDTMQFILTLSGVQKNSDEVRKPY